MEKSIILIVLLSLLPFEGNMERVAAQRVDGIECDFNAFAKLKWISIVWFQSQVLLEQFYDSRLLLHISNSIRLRFI